MKPFLCLLTATALLAGCATAGRKIDPAAVDKIHKGQTTRQEVLALIGSPDQMTRTGNGDVVFNYAYIRASAKATTFIPVVGAFAGGMNTQNELVMITFGPDGIVKDMITSQGSTDARTNLGAGSKASLPEVEDNKRPK